MRELNKKREMLKGQPGLTSRHGLWLRFNLLRVLTEATEQTPTYNSLLCLSYSSSYNFFSVCFLYSFLKKLSRVFSSVPRVLMYPTPSFCIATVSYSANLRWAHRRSTVSETPAQAQRRNINFVEKKRRFQAKRMLKNVLNFSVNKKSLFLSYCFSTKSSFSRKNFFATQRNFQTKFTLKLCFIMQKFHAFREFFPKFILRTAKRVKTNKNRATRLGLFLGNEFIHF